MYSYMWSRSSNGKSRKVAGGFCRGIVFADYGYVLWEVSALEVVVILWEIMKNWLI